MKDILLHPDIANNEAIEWSQPSLFELAVFINRLLRFQYPVSHWPDICRTFLLRHCTSAGVSKSFLAKMPPSQVDYYISAIACDVLNVNTQNLFTPDNLMMNLAVLAVTAEEFNDSRWLKDDIQFLSAQQNVSLHKAFYEANDMIPGRTLSKETETGLKKIGYKIDQLEKILESHHYRTDFLTAFNNIQTGYLACKVLTYPFPWQVFMSQIHDDIHPYLNIKTMSAVFSRLPLNEASPGVTDLSDHEQITELVSQYQDLTASLRQNSVSLSGNTLSGNTLLRPFRMLILVEGKTEKKILPVLAKLCGLDFETNRIQLVDAGGKNQMTKLYAQLSQTVSLPMTVLLDLDAEPIAGEIRSRLRETDQLLLLENGEFEDLYDDVLIAEAINSGYAPYPELTLSELREMGENLPDSRVNQFKQLWKERELGTFDKIHFADQVIQTMQETGYIPQRLQVLMSSIKEQYRKQCCV